MNTELHESLLASREARKAGDEKLLRDIRIVRWMVILLLVIVLWPLF